MIEDFKVDDVVKIIDGRSFSKEEKIAHEGEVGVIVRDDLPFLEVKMNALFICCHQKLKWLNKSSGKMRTPPS